MPISIDTDRIPAALEDIRGSEAELSFLTALDRLSLSTVSSAFVSATFSLMLDKVAADPVVVVIIWHRHLPLPFPDGEEVELGQVEGNRDDDDDDGEGDNDDGAGDDGDAADVTDDGARDDADVDDGVNVFNNVEG